MTSNNDLITRLRQYIDSLAPPIAKRYIEEAISGLETLQRERNEAVAEVARLNAIINSPQSGDFLRAVSTEAEHQRQRWGSEHDAGKTNADWNALIGYLLAKALIAMATGDREKSEHHVITAAAALKNWHAAVTGHDNVMRPGYADGQHPGVEQGAPA